MCIPLEIASKEVAHYNNTSNIMNYHSLDKHFTAPKNMSFNCKRVPRKFKKKWKHILNTYDFLTLNQKLWYIQGLTNPNYNRFLIKKIIHNE